MLSFYFVMDRVILKYQIYLTFVTLILSTSIREFRRKEELPFRNRLATSGLMYSTNNTHMLACANLCLIDNDCEWISYKKDTKSCRYHSVHQTLVDIVADTTAVNGWASYIFLENWCPNGDGFIHNRRLDLCYKLFLGKVTCTTAFSICSNNNADVLIIDSAEKQNYITTIIVNGAVMNSAWLNAYLSGGEWVWSTGIPISSGYTNWDKDPHNTQPQNLPGCVGISSVWSYYWHDFESHFTFDTVCEIRRPTF